MSKSPKAVSKNLSDPRQGLIMQLRTACLVFLGVLAVGCFGFYLLGQGRWSLWDCVYMTVITISTVGYGETLADMGQVPWARHWTLGLIILGSGTLLYFASTFTAFIVEGDLRGVIQRKRMRHQIEMLKNHVVVCGVGSTGIHIVEELIATQTDFVVIDQDPEVLAEHAENIGPQFLYIVGDATEDDTLMEANIKKASGLVAALDNDPENLFVTITARALNTSIRIVAKAIEQSTNHKLMRAGANAVVSPNFIGAMRMVSELIRPSVVNFLDVMLRDKESARRIEEITIRKKSKVINKALRDANIRQNTEALVIAIRLVDGAHKYNPGPNHIIREGEVLIVLAKAIDVKHIRKYIASP